MFLKFWAFIITVICVVNAAAIGASTSFVMPTGEDLSVSEWADLSRSRVEQAPSDGNNGSQVVVANESDHSPPHSDGCPSDVDGCGHCGVGHCGFLLVHFGQILLPGKFATLDYLLNLFPSSVTNSGLRRPPKFSV